VPNYPAPVCRTPDLRTRFVAMPHPFRRNQAPVWSQHSTRLVALGAANPLKELRKSNPESMNLRELEISAVDKL
jgi:hypothetical protein